MARHRIHSFACKKQVVQEYAAGATLNGILGLGLGLLLRLVVNMASA